LDREAFLPGVEARAFRHRPALVDPLQLESQVVVQAARGVLVDDEPQLPLRGRAFAARLGRAVEIALLSIDLEDHGQALFLWPRALRDAALLRAGFRTRVFFGPRSRASR